MPDRATEIKMIISHKANGANLVAKLRKKDSFLQLSDDKVTTNKFGSKFKRSNMQKMQMF